ncbi:hypothetical protein CXF59_05275 [Flavobacterium sp. ALD4]|uniref:beta strand repeat-containing protein n=1 Tax=Flavobacterium sp. ALD4 TaxID=2058314 RepID=UPI000C334BD5|nr:LamG-like jellyroll fold domain-containing protein [Flavobacterium sp. ALD4]PKH67894.1 hypothetical protein CXF59_05275 [Flavobacterium sp. ALD4]
MKTIKLLIITLLISCSAYAAPLTTYTVTSLSDDGSSGTLRWAINQANADVNPNQIDFQAGFTGTITLTSDLPTITRNLTIIGPGIANLTLSGNNLYKMFFINNDSALNISGITFRANASFNGSVFRADSTNSSIVANSISVTGNARSYAFYTNDSSTITISNSTFTNNSGILFGSDYGSVPSTTSDTLTDYTNRITVTGSTFDANTGTIFSTQRYVKIDNCNFTNNTKTIGSFNGVNRYQVLNSTFTDNTGGTLFSFSSWIGDGTKFGEFTLATNNTLFNGNTFTGNPGILINPGGNSYYDNKTTISNNIFSNNGTTYTGNPAVVSGNSTPPPTISSFTPTAAGTGESVVIIGTNFDSVTQVQFGSVSASSFTIDSPTQITAVVAAGSSGNVTLTKAVANVALAGFIYKIVAYNFNSNALDETGSNRDGSISGGVTFGTGVEGQSACFDRTTSNYIALPNNLIRSLSDFTISLRFKTSSKGIILGYQQAAVDIATSLQYIPIIMVQSGGKLRATLWKTTGSDISVLSSTLVNDGNWHKVDMSVTPTSISFYLDGLLVGSGSGTVNHLDMQVNQIGRGMTSIDRDSSGGDLSGWQGFTGCIDNFLILDKGQSLATMTQVTQLPVPQLTSFTPAVCNIGDTVTITGTNFTGATSVLIGTIPVTNFTVVSDTQITAVTNLAQVSSISVITAGGTAVSATTVTVNKLNPTLSNFNNATKKYFDATYTLIPPTSSIAEAFSYSSSDLNVATISGSVVTITGAGTATITATQAGNSNYNTASITATLTVTSVSVLTKGGGISGANLNYVNQYGQIGGNFGLSANGAILNVKSPASIVSAGLVMYLDAGNTASYAGSGTTWTDLSGNGNHGTLFGGVGYTSVNSGALVFDGVNDYFVTNNNFNLSSTDKLTVQIILKTANSGEEMIMEHSVNWNANNSFGVIQNSNKIQFSDIQFTDKPNYNVRNSVAAINDNNWHLFSATTDRSLNATNQTLIYIDGDAPSSVIDPTLANDNSGNYTSHKLYIASRAGSSYLFNGTIGQVFIYNRVLTAAEIQQNFYAVKLKYGL